MKKIIGFIAITALLFACSKTDIPLTENSEAVASEKAKGGNGNGGGGSSGGGGGSAIVTAEASYILPFGAISGGEVASSGGGNNVTERGVCYSTDPEPTIDDDKVISGSGSGTFTSALTGLLDNTTYYSRAYAIKIKNNGTTTTTYGDEQSFTTPEAIYGTVEDIDGNIYATIEIGSQVWMMENLKTTKYRDGTLIPNVTDGVAWETTSSGAYCDYNNNVQISDSYGRLYNGYSLEHPSDLAPEGWHVATEDDVRALTQYVRGSNPFNNDTGARLKETGTLHWLAPNAYSDNSSGFTALPGGFRRVSAGEFSHLRYQGRWWATTSSGGTNLEYFHVRYNNEVFMGSMSGDVYPSVPSDPFHKNNGYSVRCVKD